jgi:hypothetical protein
MSLKPWRTLRALRVVLACLVLWLPARSAAASLGPVDTVVMIAGATAANARPEVRGAMARSGAHDERSFRNRAGHELGSPSTSDIDVIARQACRADRGETANRTVVERLYLHCCVFLR